MYCRNCGTEVNDKAVACPKCGVPPRLEKKFCPSCGTATNPNQIACTKCGSELSGPTFSMQDISLEGLKSSSFLKNKPAIFATLALLCCFLPWMTIEFFAKLNLNLFKLAQAVDMAPDSILIPLLMDLYPLLLVGVIACHFVPSLAKHEKLFSVASLLLLIYIGAGFYQLAQGAGASRSEPDDLSAYMENRQYMQDLQNMARKTTRDLFSIGYGFYGAIVFTALSVFFRFTRK